MREPSRRQVEVAATVVSTGTQKEAAHSLGLSVTSIRNHLTRLSERTGTETTLQAIAWLDDHAPGWRPPRPRL